jgi:DNA repair photolyase
MVISMQAQETVALLTTHRGPDPDQEVRRASYHPLPCRTVLNRSPNPHYDFYWSINPYRGCEFGCAYCYARHTHAFIDEHDPTDFERHVYVKLTAPDVLAATASEARLAGRRVALGTASDPYQPAERGFRITRRLLEVLARHRTLDLSITTKSDLLLRDLELLAELARTRRLTVNMSLSTVDPNLARLLEPGAPTPDRRLSTVAKLASVGVRAGVFAMPILPFLTDHQEGLRRLFAGARQAGAAFVTASMLNLRPDSRRRYLAFIAARFPHLLASYRHAYGGSAYLRGPLRDRIAARVARMRRSYGFAGRGAASHERRAGAAPPRGARTGVEAGRNEPTQLFLFPGAGTTTGRQDRRR